MRSQISAPFLNCTKSRHFMDGEKKDQCAILIDLVTKYMEFKINTYYLEIFFTKML